jgi:hypothetical protein
MLGEIIRGLVGYHRSNILRVIVMLRHEIALRGVLDNIGCLNVWMRNQLVKKRWFRDAAMLGGASTLEKGVRRSVEVIVGPPPRERFYGIITAASARLQRENTKEWIGKRVRPLEQKLDRETWYKSRRSTPSFSLLRKFKWDGLRWAFVWPKSLYEVIKDFPIFHDGSKVYYTDHPFLVVRPRILEVARPRLRHYPPPVALLMGVDNLPRRI